MRSRTACCAVASTTGRNSAKLRRSPFTLYCRAGNVTFRPPAPRRSQIANPISLSPARGPSAKWSSASPPPPVGLDGGLHGSAPPGNRDWFLREKPGTITRPGEDRSGARGARGHRRPQPACPGSLARRTGGLLGAAGGRGRVPPAPRTQRPPNRRHSHVETASRHYYNASDAEEQNGVRPTRTTEALEWVAGSARGHGDRRTQTRIAEVQR